MNGRQGLFFNDAVHWTGKSYTNTACIIIAYNMRRREFEEMTLPDRKDAKWADLLVLDECLCALVDCDTHVEVWVMKQYLANDSWTMLFADADLKKYVGLTAKGDFLMQKTAGGLCLYDPQAKQFRDLKSADATHFIRIGERYADSILPPQKSRRLVPLLSRIRARSTGQQTSGGLVEVPSDDGGNSSRQVGFKEMLDKILYGCSAVKDSDGSLVRSSEDELDEDDLT